MALEMWFMFTGLLLGTSVTVCGVIIRKLLIEKMWPITVPLIIQRGKDGFVWDFQRAKYVSNSEGVQAIRMQKDPKNPVRPPEFEKLNTNTKGKAVMPLWQGITGQYFNMKVNNKVSIDSIEDKGSRNWGITIRKHLRQKYTDPASWLAKYGIYAMNAIFASMVIFFVIYFGGKMEIAAGGVASASESLTLAVKMMTIGGGMPAP